MIETDQFEAFKAGMTAANPDLARTHTLIYSRESWERTQVLLFQRWKNETLDKPFESE